ncbi:MAG: ABC transporter ATP-binding protein [Clostridium sp.]
MNILELNNVSKSYGDFNLNNISFTLPEGYIMGFIGANGAGKTTTLKLIMNLVNKDSGSIKVFGLDNIKDEVQIKEQIGFVYDGSYYLEHLRLKEIKNIIAPFYKNFSDEKFKDYMTTFNLNENKRLRELSQGNKMKFSSALALSHNAKLLIMDEPTSGLDPVFRDEYLDILRSIISDEKKSILFSTHITSDLEKIADYITFIDKGNLILSEEKDLLLDNYRLIKGNHDCLTKSNSNLVIGKRDGSYNFEGLIKSSDSKEFSSDNFLIERPSLENIMLHMVRR